MKLRNPFKRDDPRTAAERVARIRDRLAAAQSEVESARAALGVAAAVEDGVAADDARRRLAAARESVEGLEAALVVAEQAMSDADGRERRQAQGERERAAVAADAKHREVAKEFDEAVELLSATYASYLSARAVADMARQAAGQPRVPRHPAAAVASALMYGAPAMTRDVRGVLGNALFVQRRKARPLAAHTYPRNALESAGASKPSPAAA